VEGIPIGTNAPSPYFSIAHTVVSLDSQVMTLAAVGARTTVLRGNWGWNFSLEPGVLLRAARLGSSRTNCLYEISVCQRPACISHLLHPSMAGLAGASILQCNSSATITVLACSLRWPQLLENHY
jgi:hypothetical protein